MTTPHLLRCSSGRRVINITKAREERLARRPGDEYTDAQPGEVAFFQDAQDAIDYVQMVEERADRDRLRDGIKALIDDYALVDADQLRALLDGEGQG